MTNSQLHLYKNHEHIIEAFSELSATSQRAWNWNGYDFVTSSYEFIVLLTLAHHALTISSRRALTVSSQRA